MAEIRDTSKLEIARLELRIGELKISLHRLTIRRMEISEELFKVAENEEILQKEILTVQDHLEKLKSSKKEHE